VERDARSTTGAGTLVVHPATTITAAAASAYAEALRVEVEVGIGVAAGVSPLFARRAIDP
jgi:hypothetical protein